METRDSQLTDITKDKGEKKHSGLVEANKKLYQSVFYTTQNVRVSSKQILQF